MTRRRRRGGRWQRGDDRAPPGEAAAAAAGCSTNTTIDAGSRSLTQLPELALLRIFDALPTRQAKAALAATCCMLCRVALQSRSVTWHWVVRASHTRGQIPGGRPPTIKGAARALAAAAAVAAPESVMLHVHGRPGDCPHPPLNAQLAPGLDFAPLRRLCCERVAVDGVVPSVVATRCPNLSALTLRGCTFTTKAGPDPPHPFPSLQRLELRGCQWAPYTRKVVNHFRGAAPRPSPAAATTHPACPQLPGVRHLIVWDMPMEWFSLLGKACTPVQIEQLELNFPCGRPLPPTVLRSPTDWAALASLRLGHVELDDCGAQWLLALPVLRRLELDGADTPYGTSATITADCLRRKGLAWGVQTLAVRKLVSVHALFTLTSLLPPTPSVELLDIWSVEGFSADDVAELKQLAITKVVPRRGCLRFTGLAPAEVVAQLVPHVEAVDVMDLAPAQVRHGVLWRSVAAVAAKRTIAMCGVPGLAAVPRSARRFVLFRAEDDATLLFGPRPALVDMPRDALALLPRWRAEALVNEVVACVGRFQHAADAMEGCIFGLTTCRHLLDAYFGHCGPRRLAGDLGALRAAVNACLGPGGNGIDRLENVLYNRFGVPHAEFWNEGLANGPDPASGAAVHNDHDDYADLLDEFEEEEEGLDDCADGNNASDMYHSFTVALLDALQLGDGGGRWQQRQCSSCGRPQFFNPDLGTWTCPPPHDDDTWVCGEYAMVAGCLMDDEYEDEWDTDDYL